MNWKVWVWILVPAALIALHEPAGVDAQLVLNGNFEDTNAGANYQLGYNIGGTVRNADNWSTTGYNFIFSQTGADTTGAVGQYGPIYMWGPGNGTANGYAASPLGGNYIAADGAFGVAPVEQTINGLTPGAVYGLGFWWAAAQQQSFDGATTEQWRVTLYTPGPGGYSETHSTAVVNNPNHGFIDWMYETMFFTADSSSMVLSFLAVGTPDGLPPFVLLDGVSMNAVPEPGTLAFSVLGLAGMAALRLRRRKRVSPAVEPASDQPA